MLLHWWKQRRRRKILIAPFPPAWRDWLDHNVIHYTRQPADVQARLRELIQIFVAEKHWEGLAGLEVTDEVKLTIAALACLLVVAHNGDFDFDHVLSILVYPDYYLARNLQPNEAGVVSTAREARLGEAWYRGPVILSWEDVLADARQERRGCNVVLHEFAHQLDMLNGRHVDGTPPLSSREIGERWERVMQAEHARLIDRCRRRRPGLIDCYGAQDRAEFFAVVTESFFEQPVALAAESPELYAVLRDFYRQDPATWSIISTR
jgi:Mlc titration factor MtfA (ptsG expression regulator)